MSQFISIKKNSDHPLIMDVGNVSVVVEHSDDNKTQIAMHNTNQGRFFTADTESWSIDADTIIAQIEQTGTHMHPLPFYWGDDRKIGRYFVNPEHVESIIVSAEKERDGEDEPCVGLLVDVKGYGRVETYKVPVSTLDEFVKAVEKVNPNMIRFDADEAGSRWCNDGFTMIDPTEIRAVHPNGYDMDIRFKDGMRLDFHLDTNKQTAKARQDYLQRLIKRIQGDGSFDDLIAKLGGNLNNLQPRLYKFEDRYRKKLREKFATAVAAKAPDLVRIENAQDVYYTNPEAISTIHANDNALYIEFKKAADERFVDRLHVDFASKEAALSGMKALTDMPATPQNKP